MTNANDKTHSLKVEKTFHQPASEVFRAIGEGRLFLNCSAQQDSLKIDFRVGGRYQIEFRAFDLWNQGEFLEVVPHSKIVFTWCQDGKKDAKPDTQVTVLLKEDAGKTHLTLTHEGFRDAELAADHQSGWSGGLEDLSREMTEGRIKFNRYFNTPVQKLYELCSDPSVFFGTISGFEVIPNEKIMFSLSGTPVTLTFESDEDDTAWLELIHEGLGTEKEQKTYRKDWDHFMTRLMEKTK